MHLGRAKTWTFNFREVVRQRTKGMIGTVI